ncbi:MAG TPA: hypothetical protein VMX17_10105 [Candidatus Glassbacteria bacterium]|nr:hypothetical protein [Candidatus Glassbacteria bacterium]
MASNKKSLKKKALLLVWIGEIWNVFEAAIALWSAWVASSVALFAFGLDSLIELFAGAVLLWRFYQEKSDGGSKEKRVLRVIGITFLFFQPLSCFNQFPHCLGILVDHKKVLLEFWLQFRVLFL